jgi:hypothetical protein
VQDDVIDAPSLVFLDRATADRAYTAISTEYPAPFFV